MKIDIGKRKLLLIHLSQNEHKLVRELFLIRCSCEGLIIADEGVLTGIPVD